MKLGLMQEFVALAESRNFTVTAKDFFITQPGLSKHIAHIEKTMGVKLLFRTTHSVELTDEGKVVYDEFKKIISQYDQLVAKTQAISHGIIGTLDIGMLYYCSNEMISNAFTQYNTEYPNVNVSIKSFQPYQVINSLLEDQIDIGLIIQSPTMPNNDFNFIPIYATKLQAFTLPTHHFTKKSSISLTDLERETIILLKVDQDYNEEVIRLLTKNNVTIDNLEYAEQIDVMPYKLEMSNGVFIGNETLQNMPHENLAFNDIKAADMLFNVGFAYKKTNRNKALTKFVSIFDEDEN